MHDITESLNMESVDHAQLSKKRGYEIHRNWLELFALKLKDHKGKFIVGNYIWESYQSGLLTSTDGDEGLRIYRSKPIEGYYVIHEGGELVFDCESESWPNLFGKEVIVFPKSKQWSMVYSHEKTVHYVEP